MTTTVYRRREILTHYSLHPPRPLSLAKIARLNEQSIEVLTLICPMLPPLNEKQRIGKRQFFIDEEYRGKERLFQIEVTRQVLAANWFVSESDVYVIHYGFSFKNATKQDYDGPLKPTQDALQPPKPTEEELWQMVSPHKLHAWYRAHPPLRDARGRIRQREPDRKVLPQLVDENELHNWHVLHPGAIRNDGQVVEASISKHINQPDPRECIITIFKMARNTYLTLTCEDPLDTRANAFLA